MAEYISADTYCKHLHKVSLNHALPKAVRQFADAEICYIKQELLADAEPVCHGTWANEETAVTCTACGRSYDTDFEIKRNVILDFERCPECGAVMGKESEENG